MGSKVAVLIDERDQQELSQREEEQDVDVGIQIEQVKVEQVKVSQRVRPFSKELVQSLNAFCKGQVAYDRQLPGRRSKGGTASRCHA